MLASALLVALPSLSPSLQYLGFEVPNIDKPFEVRAILWESITTSKMLGAMDKELGRRMMQSMHRQEFDIGDIIQQQGAQSMQMFIVIE